MFAMKQTSSMCAFSSSRNSARHHSNHVAGRAMTFKLEETSSRKESKEMDMLLRLKDPKENQQLPKIKTQEKSSRERIECHCGEMFRKSTLPFSTPLCVLKASSPLLSCPLSLSFSHQLRSYSCLLAFIVLKNLKSFSIFFDFVFHSTPFDQPRT